MSLNVFASIHKSEKEGEGIWSIPLELGVARFLVGFNTKKPGVRY